MQARKTYVPTFALHCPVLSPPPLSPQPHMVSFTPIKSTRAATSHALRNQQLHKKNRIVYKTLKSHHTRYFFLFLFIFGGGVFAFLFLCALFFCSQRPSASSLAVASGTMKCTTARQTVRCHAPCLTQKATTTTSVRPAANTPTSPPVASSKAAR